MGVRYPGPVSRHNLVCPLFCYVHVSQFGTVYYFGHDGGRVSLVDMGPPRTSPVGIESEWLGECHNNEVVSSECRWSTQMGVRGHGFRGVGKVRYL